VRSPASRAPGSGVELLVNLARSCATWGSPTVAPRPASDTPARAADPSGELAAEVGAKAAGEIPLDLAEVMARAWGAFRGRGS